jgi:hypothetical protein
MLLLLLLFLLPLVVLLLHLHLLLLLLPLVHRSDRVLTAWMICLPRSALQCSDQRL